MYLSNMAGVTVLDISAVQRRAPYPQVPHVAAYLWPDGQINQHSIPVTYRGGTPHVITADEGGSGGVKIFDVSRVNTPRYAAQLKLEINLPEHQDTQFRSSMGGSLFGSNPHYCAVDRAKDPTALACAWESSGIRVFDIRDLSAIKEIAYYNPPAQKGATALSRPNSPTRARLAHRRTGHRVLQPRNVSRERASQAERDDRAADRHGRGR